MAYLEQIFVNLYLLSTEAGNDGGVNSAVSVAEGGGSQTHNTGFEQGKNNGDPALVSYCTNILRLTSITKSLSSTQPGKLCSLEMSTLLPISSLSVRMKPPPWAAFV